MGAVVGGLAGRAELARPARPGARRAWPRAWSPGAGSASRRPGRSGRRRRRSRGRRPRRRPRATELIVQRPASPLSPNQSAASRNGSISRTSANDRGGSPARATTPRTTTASATVLAAASFERRPAPARPARAVSTVTRSRTRGGRSGEGQGEVLVEAAVRRAVTGATDEDEGDRDEPDLTQRALGDGATAWRRDRRRRHAGRAWSFRAAS